MANFFFYFFLTFQSALIKLFAIISVGEASFRYSEVIIFHNTLGNNDKINILKNKKLIIPSSAMSQKTKAFICSLSKPAIIDRMSKITVKLISNKFDIIKKL